MVLVGGMDYKMVKKAYIKKIIEAKAEHGRAFPEQTYDFADVLDHQIEKIQAFVRRRSQGQGNACLFGLNPHLRNSLLGYLGGIKGPSADNWIAPPTSYAPPPLRLKFPLKKLLFVASCFSQMLQKKELKGLTWFHEAKNIFFFENECQCISLGFGCDSPCHRQRIKATKFFESCVKNSNNFWNHLKPSIKAISTITPPQMISAGGGYIWYTLFEFFFTQLLKNLTSIETRRYHDRQ